MTRILFVAHSGKLSGGANRSLISLMLELRKQYSVEPSILIPEFDSPLRDICEANGIRVYEGIYRSCGTVFRGELKDAARIAKLIIAPFLDLLGTRRLARLISDDFDLVYTNDRMIVAGAYLARHMNLPHIWHVRCYGKENKTYFPPFWEKRMAKLSNRIVLISNDLYRKFAVKVPEGKLSMVHNGIEPDKYGVSAADDHNGFNILLTGRIVPAKGHIDAIKALKIITEKFEVDAQLYFAGSSPDFEGTGYFERLKQIVCQMELADRVHFMGEVADIASVRSNMDVEVVCSWCEAFGRVTVEAMCAGIPVIGTDSGGTPDIIEDGITGYLYKAKDIDSLAAKLMQLYESPERRREMGMRGRKRVYEYFTINACARNINSVINEVISERRI